MINTFIGHWPPSEMRGMSLSEFCDWVRLAHEKQQLQESPSHG